jgi:hypothetical protein
MKIQKSTFTDGYYTAETNYKGTFMCGSGQTPVEAMESLFKKLLWITQ